MKFRGIELCCPACRAELAHRTESALICGSCRRFYPIILGIPDLRLFADPYIGIEADREKGRKVAEHSDARSFEELLAYYYSVTEVVTPQQAEQFTRGVLAARARAETALASWQEMSGPRVGQTAGVFVDVGCGTGPLLAAAAPQFQKLVGVDIAFRWLVVAQKRLEEAGLDIPLICACAEALPFPDGSISTVASEGTLEVVANQRAALRECHRVLKDYGSLFLTTANRYSLGPDPHVGLWAAGFLPDTWLAAYIRRQGGIPPQRNFLSARTLPRLLHESGFQLDGLQLPKIATAQRKQAKKTLQILMGAYQTLRRFPITRGLLLQIGPNLLATSTKLSPG